MWIVQHLLHRLNEEFFLSHYPSYQGSLCRCSDAKRNRISASLSVRVWLISTSAEFTTYPNTARSHCKSGKIVTHFSTFTSEVPVERTDRYRVLSQCLLFKRPDDFQKWPPSPYLSADWAILMMWHELRWLYVQLFWSWFHFLSLMQVSLYVSKDS